MKTPWHLWVVGILSLLWNAVGALDYAMTKFQVEWYLEPFTPEQRAYFLGFPAWTVAAWALGVWGAVLGSVLLLLRSRLALHAFLISLAGMIVVTVYQFALAEVGSLELMGPFAVAFSAIIFVVGVLLVWYARAQTSRGVLG